MNARKWSDLQRDCLVKVFEKVGIAALVETVPFVCKSWYKSSLDPLCLKYLHFPYDISAEGIKAVVDRSCGNAVLLNVGFVFFLRLDEFIYVAERCPKIELLRLPNSPFSCECSLEYGLDYRDYSKDYCKEMKIVLSVVGKWKNLKYLAINTRFYFEEIIKEVSIHCKNLWVLQVGGDIGPEEVSLIITSLPEIKCLRLDQRAKIPRECFLKLLVECKELVRVDATKCYGFDAEDEEILKMASHIKVFMVEGSTLRNELWDKFSFLFDPKEFAKLSAAAPIIDIDIYDEI